MEVLLGLGSIWVFRLVGSQPMRMTWNCASILRRTREPSMSTTATTTTDGEQLVVPRTADLETAPTARSHVATILIVDDDMDMRRLAEQVVRRDGHEALLVENGEDALKAAHDHRPDLILLDCQMPGLDGFDVCQRLRENQSLTDIPVIFLTGLTSTSDKTRGLAVGGSDYVTKPVDRAELTARIRTHLELGRVRRELRRNAEQLERLVKSQTGRLDQARDGQQSLLVDPKSFPELNIAVRFQPAHEAGGDFYEVMRFTDDEFGFFVADVSGHDLGVAYVTGALKALTGCFTSEVLSVDETMFLLNSGLRKFLPVGRYTTACYAKYSVSDSTVELGSAGHPAPFVQRKSGDSGYLDLCGDILGMHETVFCGSTSISVCPGDRLYLYTDGLIESYPDSVGRKGSRSLGCERFKDAVVSMAEHPLQQTVDSVVDDVVKQCSGAVTDDVILLGIEF